MRVENIGTSKNIPGSPQRPGLAEGDVLVAEVTDIKGDKVFLKNQEGGAVLTAKLLGDIGVAVGDYVETVVDEASGGRYVLRVVDISRQTPFGTESQLLTDMQAMSQAVKAQALLSTLAMLKNNPGADPKAAAFLSRHGIAGTAENIEILSQMAKGSSPVTVLLAQIIESFGTSPKTFSQSGPAMPLADGAAQNPQAAQTVIQNGTAQSAQPAGEATADKAGQSQPQSGPVQGSAAWTGAMQNQAASADTVPNQASAGSGQTSATQNNAVSGNPAQNVQQQALPDQANMPDTGTQTAPQAAPDANTPRTPVQHNQNPAQPVTNPATGGTEIQTPQSAPSSGVPVETAPAAQVNLPDQAAPQAPAAPNTSADVNTDVRLPMEETTAAPQPERSVEIGAAGAKSAAVQSENTAESTNRAGRRGEEIAQKALDMFVRLDDAEKLAVHIKKAVQEMPEQLKELKLLADHADITVRDVVSSKLDQAEKQMSLMSEVKRFDCYQIPLQTGNQQQATAELFVYRYRGGKKAVDPDNILILVGLDTQYMGRVETLVKTSGKTLNIEFNMEDMRLADDMRADAAQLKGAVQQAGYTLAGVSVKQLTSRTTVLNAEERLEKETDGSAGNVDIRV